MKDNTITVNVQDNTNIKTLLSDKLKYNGLYKIKNISDKEEYFTARDKMSAGEIKEMTGLLARKAIATGKFELYNPKKEKVRKEQKEFNQTLDDVKKLKAELEAEIKELKENKKPNKGKK